jgi:hypothetical protein
MDEMTRRGLIHGATSASLLALLAPGQAAAAGNVPDAEATKLDRQAIVAAGLTEAEADCWETTGKLAGMLFDLPQLHVMDRQEIADAIHIIQYRLLSRPTYRKYKDALKDLAEKGKQKP